MTAAPTFDCDLLIVGGGPSGSLCAALVRKQVPELRVVVVEQAEFPRHHVGEACLPGWASILERAGVLEQAQAEVKVDKLGFVFLWGPEADGEAWTADFRGEDGSLAEGSWHVDRAWMDNLFLNHAAELGVTVLQPSRVTDIRPLSGPTPPPIDGPSPGFSVDVEKAGVRRTLTTRTVVDGSGQARLLTRLWKLKQHRHDDMNNYAIYGYWKGGALELNGGTLHGRERWAVVSSCELGWVWHIPVAADVTSVGLVTDKDTLARIGSGELLETYLEVVRGARRIGGLLEEATYLGDRTTLEDGSDTRVNVIQDWSYRCGSVVGAGWFQMGDGAVFVDPVLASGLTLASTGASMVANAITNLETDPDVKPELLRQSFASTYRDIASAYHRMARVWYSRNARTSAWHWRARQERLRTAGGLALFEDDADAFTAVCLGVINSPLDAALPDHSSEIWGSEYFTWITSDRLFGRDGVEDGGRSLVTGIVDAKTRSRRALLERWRKLAFTRATLNRQWAVTSGYHTNRFVDRWKEIRYVEVQLDDPLDAGLRIACPAFADRPEGIFSALDGSVVLRDAVAELLASRKIGDPERRARWKAATESLLQLDMLGLLDLEEVELPAPKLGSHPLITHFARSGLMALPWPARLVLEVDFLGESVWAAVMREGVESRIRISPLARTHDRRVLARTRDCAFDWPKDVHDWADVFVRGWVRRLALREQKLAKGALWADMQSLVGLGVAFTHVPGEVAVAERL